ncbi:MAG: transcriptional repressor LexA [Actinomycetia bacterium]|nr:transcriptional repressor LexA [Actinomycetes bacterium]MCH9801959.1 transcriptional repressor LexA [Actinomycetes bacterium]
MSAKTRNDHTDSGDGSTEQPVPLLTARQRTILTFIRERVEEKGFPPSVREIGEAVGLTSTSSVAHQLRVLEEKGYLRRDPNTPRALLVTDGAEPLPNTKATSAAEPELERGDALPDSIVAVPLLGQIAAGGPILAEQAVEETFPLPRELVGEGELFLLRVRGDSMIDAAICDGDFVAVRSQPTAENGEIVAALLDDEATVKTLSRRDGHVWLLPANDSYAPIPGDSARIMGKVVSVFRRL